MTDDVKPAWELEQEARATNAQPWEPLSGMVKKRCLKCLYLFAVRLEEAETTSTCPDCAPSQTGSGRTIRRPDPTKKAAGGTDGREGVTSCRRVRTASAA
jgi:hypothetical protein